jgi:hypothetical protein
MAKIKIYAQLVLREFAIIICGMILSIVFGIRLIKTSIFNK